MKRSLDDVYSAEDGDGVNSNDDSDSPMDNDNENDNEDFDLFASSVKQDWSSHPQFKALMDSGLQMIKTIGFMSPKAGQGSNRTMHERPSYYGGHYKSPFSCYCRTSNCSCNGYQAPEDA